MIMLKNILLVVSDIERSKEFYQEYFGLQIVRDFGENVILTEGLVLQEQKNWEKLIRSDRTVGNASCLFFVENNLDAFLTKIEQYSLESKQQLSVRENSWGKRTIMLKDPDGHLLEVSE
jgi:catechol 2,3-dioxygenase-like lactoylglutathione lyase family enzyme